MAGLEIVVRPVVLPNIRPQAARVLPREDDPEQGLCVIRGNPAQSIELSFTHSFNASSSRNYEVERKEDKARTKQKEDDGTINDDNFIDTNVAKEIKKKGPAGDDWSARATYGSTRPKTIQQWIEFYMPVQEADNIEIKKRDIITKNPEGD